MSKKEKLLEYARINDNDRKINRNLMGCDEGWYDPYFAIKHTFTVEEIESMSENEINNLLKLAENISEALY